MNTETLDRLEALLAKSADGPWHVVLYGDGDSLVIHDAREEYRVCFMATPGSDEGSMEQIEAHAKLIAEMRSALPPVRFTREDVEKVAIAHAEAWFYKGIWSDWRESQRDMWRRGARDALSATTPPYRSKM